MESNYLRFFDRFTRRILFTSTFLGFFLVTISLVAVNFGLTESVTGLEKANLLLFTFFSMVLGWLLGVKSLRGWQGLILLLVSGIVVLLVRVTNIMTRLLVLFWLLCKSWGGFMDDPRYGFPYADYIRRTWEYLQFSLADIVARIGHWKAVVGQGQTTIDIIPLTLVWGVILWIIFGWAGWSLRRKYNSLLILTPAMVLLAGVLSYVNDRPYGLIFVLGSVLFLGILIPQVKREEKWIRTGEDFSNEIRLDLALYAIPVTFIVLVIALIIPSISIHEIADTIRELTERRSDNSQTVVESLGLSSLTTKSASESSSTAGLPNRHILGAGPELTQDLVMVIQTHEIRPLISGYTSQVPNRYYWRGTVYDRYIGTGWITSTTVDQNYPANALLQDEANAPPHHTVRQSVREYQDLGNIVYRAGTLVTTDQDFTVSWRRPGDDFAVTVPTRTYIAVSMVPTITESELRAASTDYPPEIKQYYLQLPDNIPARVLDLANDLTLGQATAYDKARAIEKYLRTIPYNIKIAAPPANRDIVDYFLFDLKQGYCDYFATAMVVLARQVGLPARLAIGYATGAYDGRMAQYVITEADSHSWPEIYFPGYGWIEFEPTSNMSLYQYTATDRPVETPVPTSTITPPAPEQDPLTGWQLWTAALAALLILAAVALSLFHRRKPEALTLSGPERAIYHTFHNLYRISGRFKTPLRGSDTPYEFVQNLVGRLSRLEKTGFGRSNLAPATEEIDELTSLYSRSIYSKHSAGKKEVKRARQVWGKLRTRLWMALLLYRW